MKEADTALIQKYLESEYDDAFYALYVYQREQRHRRLGMKYEKILISWDQCMDRLPKIPKDWLRWQKKLELPRILSFIITAAGKIRQDIVVGVKAKFQSAILTIMQWGIPKMQTSDSI